MFDDMKLPGGNTPTIAILGAGFAGLGMAIRLREEGIETFAIYEKADEVGGTWSRLMTWAARHGLIGAGNEMLGLCHDDPDITPHDRIRYDACLVVPSDVEAEGRFAVGEIPGGEYAVCRHVGPYHELGRTYLALLGHWLPSSGREAVQLACVERYWNDPENTAPEELETDLCVLLKPR